MSVHAELCETRAGWVLTLRCDAATAATLRSAGANEPALSRLSVSVSPNLVPGEPFTVDTVRIAVEETR